VSATVTAIGSTFVTRSSTAHSGQLIVSPLSSSYPSCSRSDSHPRQHADDARLMEAVENAATLRRVDALCYLHYLLKLWVPPHVLFTSMMLVLMVLHIIQVVYFNVS